MEIARQISNSLANSALISSVNNVLWDMNRPLEGDCSLEIFRFDSVKGRDTFWHSSAHILGQVNTFILSILIVNFFPLPNDLVYCPCWCRLSSRSMAVSYALGHVLLEMRYEQFFFLFFFCISCLMAVFFVWMFLWLQVGNHFSAFLSISSVMCQDNLLAGFLLRRILWRSELKRQSFSKHRSTCCECCSGIVSSIVWYIRSTITVDGFLFHTLVSPNSFSNSISQEGQPFERIEVTKDQALEMFSDSNFKVILKKKSLNSRRHNITIVIRFCPVWHDLVVWIHFYVVNYL